jgi:hypothetical protein
LAACLCLPAACSRAPEPPRGWGGLAFGDPPPATAAPERVPLPSALAESLRFYALPAGDKTFLGVTLPRPVLAFYQGRFFSVASDLDAAADAQALRARLTRAYGRPYCRDGAKLAICLWRTGDVDAVLEVPQAGPARFMLRHRPTAAQVAAATGRPQPAPGGDFPPQP